MRIWPYVLILTACVKGNPDDGSGEFNENGGTLEIDGCGYSVTTKLGAEAPKKGGSSFGADPTPMQVHLGLMKDPRTSMVVQWRTKDETTTATTIRYGVGANLSADQLTETATGIHFGFRATGTAIYRVHQAHLCDLEPGTTYSYQVGGTGHFSPVYTFHTAPDVGANPDAEVVFGFVGDSRGGYDIWAQLIAQIQMRTPDLVLFSGDAVTVGLTQFEWDDFFTRAEPLFATVPVIAAHGNHEVNAVNFFSQLALPGDQQNFGIDYGHAHVTVANDTPEDPTDITGAIHDAIASDFGASDTARWKLFMHHQPMWSASTRHGSSVTLQQSWQPLIDQHHIDLVLSGHDHDYEITKPLVGNQVQTTNALGTVYVVAGGAGAELYQNGTDFWTQFSESNYSAAVIRVSRYQLTLDPFHPDGTGLGATAGFTKTKP
jgi:predicted MPP superfamily phosphohydrolase